MCTRFNFHLFFAIKGDSSDGHDYVAKAFENGAAAAVVDEAHSSQTGEAAKDLPAAKQAPTHVTAKPVKARPAPSKPKKAKR